MSHSSRGRKDHRPRIMILLESLKERRFATITIDSFLIVTAFSMMTTSFAYYTLVKFGYDAAETGYLLGFVGLIGAVMQGIVFGGLVKRFGEAKLVIGGCVMLVVSLLAVPFISSVSGGLTIMLCTLHIFSL